MRFVVLALAIVALASAGGRGPVTCRTASAAASMSTPLDLCAAAPSGLVSSQSGFAVGTRA